jgi:hypothetical protein
MWREQDCSQPKNRLGKAEHPERIWKRLELTAYSSLKGGNWIAVV